MSAFDQPADNQATLADETDSCRRNNSPSETFRESSRRGSSKRSIRMNPTCGPPPPPSSSHIDSSLLPTPPDFFRNPPSRPSLPVGSGRPVPMENYRIPAGAGIGHVHLKVARHRSRAGVLQRRARLRPGDATGRSGRLLVGGWLSSPHRAQHMAEPARRARRRRTTPVSITSPFAIRPAAISPTPSRRVVGPRRADTGCGRPWRQRVDRSRRSRWQRHRAHARSPRVGVASRRRRKHRDSTWPTPSISKPSSERPNNAPDMRIGIDIGGTKIQRSHSTETRELMRRRIAAPRGEYGATISRGARDCRQRSNPTPGQTGTIGLGIPGTISTTTGLVKTELHVVDRPPARL